MKRTKETPKIAQPKVPFPETIVRFDNNQRLQHLILFISILFLVLTGFPIKYGHTAGARFVVSLFQGFDNMLKVHLTAAVVMLLSGLYHIIWLILIFRKNGPKWSMVPSFKDARDAFHHAQYLLGVRDERPQYGRYSYLEKFEYLAVIYGILLMGISGCVLWFPHLAAGIMPRWVIDMFRVAHSNEAVVCVLAVVIGHFFWVHFHPDVFPSSSVWYNGKITKDAFKKEHPLEYEQLKEFYAEEPPVNVLTELNQESEEMKPYSSNVKNTPRLLLELCIYISVLIFLLSVFVPKLFA